MVDLDCFCENSARCQENLRRHRVDGGGWMVLERIGFGDRPRAGDCRAGRYWPSVKDSPDAAAESKFVGITIL